jgi:hypothetical protein
LKHEVNEKPTYHTISTENSQLQGTNNDNKNAYQAKINYFQHALRNSKTNSALGGCKESQKKLKAFVRNSENAQIHKNIRMKKKKHREGTPTSHTVDSEENHHGMVMSQSAKNQVILKNELSNSPNSQKLEQQIQKLNEKIKSLELENKQLKDENQKLKTIRESNAHKGMRQSESHYKPQCSKMHSRDDSRSSTNYNLMSFTQSNKIADFTRSYSFENSNNSNAIRSQDAEPRLAMN